MVTCSVSGQSVQLSEGAAGVACKQLDYDEPFASKSSFYVHHNLYISIHLTIVCPR